MALAACLPAFSVQRGSANSHFASSHPKSLQQLGCASCKAKSGQWRRCSQGSSPPPTAPPATAGFSIFLVDFVLTDTGWIPPKLQARWGWGWGGASGKQLGSCPLACGYCAAGTSSAQQSSLQGPALGQVPWSVGHLRVNVPRLWAPHGGSARLSSLPPINQEKSQPPGL